MNADIEDRSYMNNNYAQWDLAWAAGFIDGEGSINLGFSNNQKSITLNLSAKQIDPRPLIKLSKMFGGNVRELTTLNKRGINEWYIIGNKAKEALILLQPFLVNKKIQARLAVACMNERGKIIKGSYENDGKSLSFYREEIMRLHKLTTKEFREEYELV